jgi:hypothetical protein
MALVTGKEANVAFGEVIIEEANVAEGELREAVELVLEELEKLES